MKRRRSLHRCTPWCNCEVPSTRSVREPDPYDREPDEEAMREKQDARRASTGSQR